MIVGPDFVWIHFPKSAGTETTHLIEAIAGTRRDIHCDPHDPKNVIWHHAIAQREKYDPAFRLGSRQVVANMRRLPAWLLSRVHYEKGRTPDLGVTREMFVAGKFWDVDRRVKQADDYIRHFARPKVDLWLRTEYLEQDFERVFSRFIDLSVADWRKLMVRRNSLNEYIKDPGFYLTQPEIDGLYRANPLWAGIEERVYGSTYRLPEGEPVAAATT